MPDHNLYEKFFKRMFDLFVAICGLTMLSPLLIILLMLLAMTGKGSVFFIQQRPGLHAYSFRLVKFRTMKDIRDARGNLLPDSERLTKLGRMFRSLSFDELPQLWNVLMGDMSLVGPRPLLKEYLPLYTTCQARRHEVRPGITGWAQVNGRNAISWEEKFELDVWYVDNISFRLDMRILFMTLLKVVKREGINSATEATMEKFKGSSKAE